MTDDWPEEFEKLLRDYLPLLGDDVPLAREIVLADVGLDSLSTVGLLVNIEETFGIRFPDDALNLRTFSSPSILWSVVSRLREMPPE